jgi:predicted DNA-binding helix-hairpin-helix protein
MAHVEHAVRLATRVSVNLEAPTPEHLRRIAPDKTFGDLATPLLWARDFINGSGGALATGGMTTQFVVGAAQESDRDLLHTAARLYRDIGLRRAYFSAFQPVDRTPLEDLPPTPPLREHRLYQADFLMRQYGFRFEDLVFGADGNLPVEADPKLVWARRHPERFPMEVNRASREDLLRVPGIGPRSAGQIAEHRRRGTFCTLKDLARVGVVTERAAPYVLLNGKRPAFQLPLI